ncbi:MAG: alpha/beta fold hydrolase [Actinomycetota bacterium]
MSRIAREVTDAAESLNGVTLWVEVNGSRELLVLVHGSWVDHHAWRAVVPLLAEQFQVVTYDRRATP